MSNLNKEEIQKRIDGLKMQREQLTANLYACDGAIQALEALLVEKVQEPEKVQPSK